MTPSTILLVDDDPLIRSLGQEILEHLGYRVATAPDGPEAVRVFRNVRPVDLVILDFYLPGGNGCQVIEELKALDPGVRVLVASGFFPSQEAAQLQRHGVVGLLNKPFRLEELKMRIREVMGAGSGS